MTITWNCMMEIISKNRRLPPVQHVAHPFFLYIVSEQNLGSWKFVPLDTNTPSPQVASFLNKVISPFTQHVSQYWIFEHLACKLESVNSRALYSMLYMLSGFPNYIRGGLHYLPILKMRKLNHRRVSYSWSLNWKFLTPKYIHSMV